MQEDTANLDEKGSNSLLIFAIVPSNPVHRFWNIFENKIQVDFILLYTRKIAEFEIKLNELYRPTASFPFVLGSIKICEK